jgi:hypothetical protein
MDMLCGGIFGGAGNGAMDTIRMPKALKKAHTPAQVRAEIRAQFRKRIKPAPVATPNIATPRNRVNIISRPILRKAGVSGVCAEPTRAKLIRTRERPRMVRTLPAMATTAAAITDPDAEGFEDVSISGRCISLRELARKRNEASRIKQLALDVRFLFA